MLDTVLVSWLTYVCESRAMMFPRDSELADIDKERREQEKGPQARLHELEELAKIYENR